MPSSWAKIKKWRCWKRFSKVAKTFRTLQKIVRWIALIDALIGITILLLILTKRSIEFQEKTSRGIDENEKIGDIIKLTVLSLKGAQIIFAVILYEGARKVRKYLA